MPMMRRAAFSDSSFAWSSAALTSLAALRRASSVIFSMTCFLASSGDSPATCSSFFFCSPTSRSTSLARSVLDWSRLMISLSLRTSSLSRWASRSFFFSRLSSRLSSRSSSRCSSSRVTRVLSSNSVWARSRCSFASSSALRLSSSPSRRASARSFSAYWRFSSWVLSRSRL